MLERHDRAAAVSIERHTLAGRRYPFANLVNALREIAPRHASPVPVRRRRRLSRRLRRRRAGGLPPLRRRRRRRDGLARRRHRPDRKRRWLDERARPPPGAVPQLLGALPLRRRLPPRGDRTAAARPATTSAAGSTTASAPMPDSPGRASPSPATGCREPRRLVRPGRRRRDRRRAWRSNCRHSPGSARSSGGRVHRGRRAPLAPVRDTRPGDARSPDVDRRDQLIRRAGFRGRGDDRRVGDTAPRVRRCRPGPLLVDRDRFDAALVDRAVEVGVTVSRPAAACAARVRIRLGDRADGDRAPVRSRFVVDASGRPSNLRRSFLEALLVVTGAGVALDDPTVVTLDDGWAWEHQDRDLPTRTMARGDRVRWIPHRWRALGTDPLARDVRLVESAGIAGPADRLTGGVTTSEATSGLASEVCGPDWLAVGDAALALDRLSSSGVQRAVQSALTAGGRDPDRARHSGRGSARPRASPAADSPARGASRPSGRASRTRPWPRCARRRSTERATTIRPAVQLRHRHEGAAARGDRSPVAVGAVRGGLQVVGDRVQLAPAVEHRSRWRRRLRGRHPVVPLLVPLDGESTIGDLVGSGPSRCRRRRRSRWRSGCSGAGVIEEVGV